VIEPNETMYHPVLDEQIIAIGETFRFSIIDADSENAIYATDVLMEP
jgi:hypothetical protein